MSKQTETLKLALKRLERSESELHKARATIREALAEQPAEQQKPVAYDKTEINCFAQDLYDQKMREGKHGHYESMFYVIHQCIKKVSPQPSKPWVGLSEEDRVAINQSCLTKMQAAASTEAILREKNNG